MLTGSQTYHLMKGVSESLAGRIRIIEMPALSLREISGKGNSLRKYVPSMLRPNDISVPDGFDLWRHIHRGSMPELQDPDVDWDLFYTDYERAYLERDVRDLVNVKDEGRILVNVATPLIGKGAATFTRIRPIGRAEGSQGQRARARLRGYRRRARGQDHRARRDRQPDSWQEGGVTWS